MEYSAGDFRHRQTTKIRGIRRGMPETNTFVAGRVLDGRVSFTDERG
jgi:hypothetical protein